MLERFRTIHTESEDRELKLQQAEGLNNSIRLELLSSDTERRHLRERVSLQDREMQEVWVTLGMRSTLKADFHCLFVSVFLQHLNALQAYEAQVSSLARAMSRLEDEVQAARAEKASVLADLASVRELCVKLDSNKELTVRQLTARSMELERVRRTLHPTTSLKMSKYASNQH